MHTTGAAASSLFVQPPSTPCADGLPSIPSDNGINMRQNPLGRQVLELEAAGELASAVVRQNCRDRRRAWLEEQVAVAVAGGLRLGEVVMGERRVRRFLAG